jgi:MFS family permease
MSDRLPPEGPGVLVTVAVLSLSSMTIMANAAISSSLPGLREHFADVSHIDTLAGLLLTLPSLAIMATAGLMGWLADKVDRQKLLLVTGLLYAIGGTSGLWASGLTGMLIGRVVLGLGVAGTMVLATTWAGDLWQGRARERFLGIQGAAMSAGGIVVILLGGLLASLHWRGAFATYLLVLPAMMLGLYALAPHARRQREQAARREAAGAATTEVRFPWPAFAFVGSLGFLFMASFYVIPTRLPFRLTEMGVASPFVVAAVMSLMTVFAMPGALLYGRIRRHLSVMGVFGASWALMGAGMLVIALAPSVPVVALGVAMTGMGMGPSTPNYMSFWMGAVPAALRGRASGALTTAFFAGQFASPLVTAPLAANLGLPMAFEVIAIGQLVLAAGLGLVALRDARRAVATV